MAAADKRSKMKDGGPDAARANKKRKDATTPKGRHHQPRGQSNSGAKARHSGPMDNNEEF